jgi:hypothetical protein
MADDKVTLVVDLDAKDALAALDLFGKEAAKVVNKTEQENKKLTKSFDNAFGSLGTQLKGAIAGYLSFQAVFKGFQEAVAAENNVRALGAAIAATGEFSRQGLDGLVEYANALSDLTGIDDDAVVSSLKLAKSFGITNEQAKELVTAASNLSAVTGKDLDTTTKQLGQTLDGTIGKLADLGPEFRSITKEQAQNFEVIKKINSQYENFGAILGEGLAGSLNKLKNASDDAFKDLGRAFAEDAGLQKGLTDLIFVVKQAGPVFADLAKATLPVIKGLSIGLIAVFEAFVGVTRDILKVVGVFSSSAKTYSKDLDALVASLDATVSGLVKAGDAAEGATTPAEKFNDKMQEVSDSAAKVGKSAIAGTTEARTAFESLLKSLENVGLDEIGIVEKTEKERLRIIEEALKTRATSEKQAVKARILVEKDAEEKIAAIKNKRQKVEDDIYKEQLETDKIIQAELRGNAEQAAKDAKEAAAKQRADVSNVANNPAAILSPEVELSSGTIAALAAGITKAATRGREGAVEVVSQVAGALADLILPGIGGAVAGIASFLATASKDQIKQLVKEFVSAIPEIIKAIAENIPVIIEALAEAFSRPEFWTGLIEALAIAFRVISINLPIAIATAIFRGVAQLFKPLQDALGRLQNSLAGFANGFKDAIKPLTDALSSLRDGVASLTAPIQSLIDAIKNPGGVFGGGGGGGGGVIGKIGKSLGFANGGIVPKYYAEGGFVSRGTDTVPAMLTPGELVAPVDLTKRLDQYIDPEAKAEEQAMLAAIYQQVMSPIVVRTEAKVNQSAFADIILQLNRQNARLAG